MKYIHITEHNIRQMVIESVRHLITESSRGDKAKDWMVKIAREFGADDSEIGDIIRNFRREIFHGANIDDKYGWKYVPAFFREYMSNPECDKERLNEILIYIINQCRSSNSFIVNPESLDSNKIYEIGSVIDEKNRKETEDANKENGDGNSDYTIISDVDFQTAKKYGNQSCPDSKLCYTQDEELWNEWIKGGLYTCYILLRDGWEYLDAVHDNGSTGSDGDPFDTYGRSMIFLFISPDGSLKKSNTRWNHRADYTGRHCDFAFKASEISELIGRPFSDVFKPKGGMETIESKLASGADPNSIFDMVFEECEGFRRVYLDEKYNYLTKDNKILSKEWFDWANDFDNGLGRVTKILNGERKYNIIKPNGKLVANDWYSYIQEMGEGYFMVSKELAGEELVYNCIGHDGELLSKDWFEIMCNFRNGFSCCSRLDGRVGWLGHDGNFYLTRP